MYQMFARSAPSDGRLAFRYSSSRSPEIDSRSEGLNNDRNIRSAHRGGLGSVMFMGTLSAARRVLAISCPWLPSYRSSARTPAPVGTKYRRARPPRIAVLGASLEDTSPLLSSPFQRQNSAFPISGRPNSVQNA